MHKYNKYNSSWTYDLRKLRYAESTTNPLSINIQQKDKFSYMDGRQDLISEIKSKVKNIKDETNNETDLLLDLMSMLNKLK